MLLISMQQWELSSEPERQWAGVWKKVSRLLTGLTESQEVSSGKLRSQNHSLHHEAYLWPDNTHRGGGSGEMASGSED